MTHGLASRADVGAFLSRLVRLDAATVVRLRPADGHVQLWAPLPWGVLVGRTVPALLVPEEEQAAYRDHMLLRLQGMSEQYELSLQRKDGSRFRNTEVLTFDGDRQVRAEVYFGWNL